MEINRPVERMGRIIILNGPSGSGKSTIARALQGLLNQPTLHLDLDHFRQLFPTDYFDVPHRDAFRTRAARVLLAANRVAAALAVSGEDVILDIVLPRWDVLRDAVERFRPFQVLFVALHCAIEELERREAARGNRAGLARGQAAWVHRVATYDLELDTRRYTPEECARQIAAVLASPPSPSAFERLEARFAAGEIRGIFFHDTEQDQDPASGIFAIRSAK